MSNDLEKSLSTVAKGAGITLIGLIIGHLLGIVYSVLLGRLLGVRLYGIYNLAFSLITIASTFAAFGLLSALARFIPYHLQKGDKDTVRSTIRFGLEFVLFLSIIMGLIMYIFSNKIAIDLFHEDDLLMILPYLALCLPFFSLPNIFGAIIRAYKAVKYHFFINNIGTAIVKLIIFIPFIFIGYRLFGAIVAYISAMIFSIFTSIFIIKTKLFSDYTKYKRIPVARNLLSFSFPLFLSDITFLFVSKTDILLLGYYLSAEDIGMYTPPLVIASFLLYISNSFEYIFLPVVSELFSKGKMDLLEKLLKTASKWSFLLASPGFLFFLLFPKEILTFLYGTNYSAGYLAFVILSLGISMNIFTGLTGNILLGSGHSRLNLTCEIIAAMINVTLCFILIPIYGILGAAIGTGTSYFIRNLASLAFVYKITKMHPYKKDYIKIIIVGGAVLGIIHFMKISLTRFIYWPILMVFLGFLLIILFFTLLLLIHAFDKNDLLIIKKIEKKLGIRLNFIRRFI